jgi:hypothetical protein
MGNVLLTVGGLILLGLSLVAYVYALPSLSDATDVNTATWENSSSFVKGTVGAINSIIMLMPFLMFFGGFGMIIMGTK